ETIQAILEKEIAFWDRVKNLNPPEATSVSDVSLMVEKDAGTSIEADGKALALFNDLRDMKSRRKSLEEEIAISEEKLKM
ncbi:endonuclease, partial [Escherichia coli]|nr:endonuclease [Escherichia coli]